MAQMQFKSAMPGLAPAACGLKSKPQAPQWIAEPNPRAKYVIDWAEFAVDEYNKSTGSKLEFEDVLNAWHIPIAFGQYGNQICAVVLRATDCGSLNTYEAFIWKKITNVKELMCFEDYPSA